MAWPFDTRNQTSPFGGGYAPGYNDPLSQPGGIMRPGDAIREPRIGMAGPRLTPPGIITNPTMAGSGGAPLTSARQNQVRGVGSYIREPLDWLKEGAGNVVEGAGRFLSNPENFASAVDLLGTGAMIFGANQDRKAFEREAERQREIEEEERQRRAGYGPLVGSVLRRMTDMSGG